jgi:hypothetical protein
MKKLQILITAIALTLTAFSAPAYPPPPKLADNFHPNTDYAQIINHPRQTRNVIIEETSELLRTALNLQNQGYVFLGFASFAKRKADGPVTREEIVEFAKSIGAAWVTHDIEGGKGSDPMVDHWFHFFAYGPDYGH